MEIKKIKIRELESFIQSDTFQQFETIPLSTPRAFSYINNPNAKPEDIVLYMGYLEKKLVAFRTIFAGKTNQNLRFGWCSGNWVHPSFRRKGFSEQLLNEALSDWNGKLMFTNYAPNSEKLYLKTGKFKVIHQFNGIRGYLFPKTRKLISKANRNRLTKLFFSFADFLIFIISSFRLLFFREKPNSEIRFEKITSPDDYCYHLLEEKKDNCYFARGQKELEWIFQYPWILRDKKHKQVNYPFSMFSESFNYFTVKIFYKDQPTGFFLFSVREGHLKTLLNYFPSNLNQEVAIYLKKFCREKKIEMVTIYNKQLANQLLKRKFPFLYVKKYGQKIYSTCHPELTEKYSFQDGDGDVIFT